MAGLTPSDILEILQGEYLQTGVLKCKMGGEWVFEGVSKTRRALIKTLALRLRKASDRAIDGALEELVHRQQCEATMLVRAWALGDGRVDDGALRRWCRLMAHPETKPIAHEANVWAMKQWLWQVRRNALGRPVNWHVMPVLWSLANGTGKSHEVNRLINIVGPFVRKTKVTEIDDRFAIRILGDKLVLYFDEFSGAESVSQSQFKSVISGSVLEGREMYSDENITRENKLSAIATSNKPPPHGFEDTSGARRFWPIACSDTPVTTGDRRDMALGAIDMQDVWRAVDVDSPSIFRMIPVEIRQYMDEVRNNTVRTRDSFEWYCHESIVPSPGDETTMRFVQAGYKEWLPSSGHRRVPLSKKQMAERLIGLGYNVSQRRRTHVLHDMRLIGEDDTSAERAHLHAVAIAKK